MTEQAREARARRALRRQGLIVRKDRARSWNIDHHGGYMVTDENNCLVGGQRFDLTLEDLERWRPRMTELPPGAKPLRRLPGESYGEAARRMFPDYEDTSAECDVPDCTANVAGTRTLTGRNPELDGKSFSMLARLCRAHMHTPLRQLLDALGEPASMFAVPDQPAVQPLTRHLSARQVLDVHADLQRAMSRRTRTVEAALLRWAEYQATVTPQWARSHLHPSEQMNGSDIGRWLDSLGNDLFGAVTYQVTAEMIDLAERMLGGHGDDLGRPHEEEVPSPWGFMWLDRPVPRPSNDDNGRPPLMMRAVSWARVPKMTWRLQGTDQEQHGPALRVREWAEPDEDELALGGGLVMIGQMLLPLGGKIGTAMSEFHMVHMLWILMGMEITTALSEPPDRATRKRAANLRHQDVRVVQLRRARHAKPSEPAGQARNWTCTWLVRGHKRQAPHGGTFKDGRTWTWVKPYIKGPDGMPLKASDVLYRLGR